MPAGSQSTTSRVTRSISRILPGLYDELRELARRFMARESDSHTLQPTALVHEAFIRLSESESLVVSDEAHARALAARTMRRVLVDHARRASFAKRRGKSDEIPLDEERTPGSDVYRALVELDDAFEALRRTDERRARVLELRFFAGLSLAEVAHELGVSERTVTYDSRAGAAWLRAEMAKSSPR